MSPIGDIHWEGQCWCKTYHEPQYQQGYREGYNAAMPMDVAVERDMAEAYYKALEKHLRAHGCDHDFAQVAEGLAE